MARRELTRFACYHARRLARSDAFRAYCATDLVAGPHCQALAPFFTAPPDPLSIAAAGDPDDTLLKIRMLARGLGERYGRAFFDPTPHLTPPGVFRCALETFDPDLPLSRIRASATAVSMYTSHIIEGCPNEVAADSKRLHARMLAALYCGCEYSITPKD
jgi:hypothetical protein